MRRCSWCGVELRWWQINNCRTCRLYLELDMPSPPCRQASRWDAPRDRFWGDYRAAWDGTHHGSS